jgi:RNA polymerase sigma-70 factor, ECF subfamily
VPPSGLPIGHIERMLFASPINDPKTRQKHEEFQREAVPHMDILYSYALRLTSNPEDANDLLQETYLKAYRFWSKFEQGTNCRAWLFRIMRNSYINRYRKAVKTPEHLDYDEIKDFYNTIREQTSDPNDLSERLFGQLLDDQVSAALTELPEEFRTVVILCDVENFTYEEAAEFVDCPIGTIRSRLHRGRKLLRDKLFHYAHERGYEVND